jgi:hypothetical protein
MTALACDISLTHNSLLSERAKIHRDQKANRNLKQDDLNEMVAKAMQAAFQAELVKLKKSLKR